MAIWDLFSKRQTDAAKAGVADVYQYDAIPSTLRVQVSQISLEAVGKFGSRSGYYHLGDTNNPRWAEIEQIFCREKGTHAVARGDFSGERIATFMVNCPTSDWLDLLELICVAIVVTSADNEAAYRHEWEVTVTSDDALDEVNYRLRQAGVGYQFEEGHLIRVDSQYVHAEVVKPALLLLSGPEYAGPRQEFLQAHQHYRRNENKQAIAMAANALESTFKAIFEKKGWAYSKGSRISDLVKVARANQLWPTYLDASFDQLVATLQSGLPKIRDNDASHGQGAVAREVPSFVAAYALHLAAIKIVFVAEAAASKH